MKTNILIIGLVLAIVGIGVTAYLVCDGSEEITVQCKVLSEPYAQKQGASTVVGYTLEYAFTSTTEDEIISDLPVMVLTCGNSTVKVATPKLFTSISGKTYVIVVTCPVDTDFGGYTGYLEGWLYHFELSDFMKKEGNYRIEG